MTHDGRSDLTRFSVDGYDVYFHVDVEPRTGLYPAWKRSLVRSSDHITGSNSWVTQVSGFTLSTITLSIWFDTIGDYATFEMMQGSTGTLVLLAKFVKGTTTVKHELGQDYQYFPETVFWEPESVFHNIDDGWTECAVTFERAYDPVTNPAVSP